MITAIITIYYPNINNIENILKIYKQVDKLIVCDNSECSHLNLFPPEFNIHYILFEKNNGLSKAFNFVLKDKDIDWKDDEFVVFFDQDSVIEDNYINKLINEYNLLVFKGYQIGCLGPVFFNNSNNTVEYPKNKKIVSKNSFIVNDIITSSLLTTYKNLKSIGFWNDNLFLDMADWDLCWRFTNANKLCCMTDIVILNHTVGIGEKRIGKLKLRVSNPYREYYQIRDSLYLIFKRYVPKKVKLNLAAKIFIFPILHLIFFEKRILRAKYIMLGIKDFIKGYHGEVTY